MWKVRLFGIKDLLFHHLRLFQILQGGQANSWYLEVANLLSLLGNKRHLIITASPRGTLLFLCKLNKFNSSHSRSEDII